MAISLNRPFPVPIQHVRCGDLWHVGLLGVLALRSHVVLVRELRAAVGVG